MTKYTAMFFILLTSVLFLTLSSAEDKQDDINSKWGKHKTKYGKVFNPSEDKKRFAIWRNNLDVIEKHNRRFNGGLETYQLESNRFSDYPPEEYKKILGFVPSSMCTNATTEVNNATISTSEKALFPAVDHRTSNCIGPIKNQGSCGSCYAFATTANLEHCICKKTGRYTSLSEQEVMDCSSTSLIGNGGCNGGSISFSFFYMQLFGVVPSQSYPYTAKSVSCNWGTVLFGSPVSRASGSVGVFGNEDAMAAALVKTPLTISIKAACTSFAYYSSGIYNDVNCCTQGYTDHAVLLVGMGTDNSGNKYWLIRNSWGPDWGEGGYMRMARGVNMCLITTNPSYVTC